MNIRMDFNVGPIESSENIIGSINYDIADPNDTKQIAELLKKAFKRIDVANRAIVIGFVEIFHSSKKLYDIDIFRAGNIHQHTINKV